MNPKFFISEALQALRSNVLRSLLTIVGIVVGIFSVTAMLALGEGLSANIMDRFSSLSAGDLTVSGDITYADYEWIKEQPYIESSLASLSINITDVIVNNTDFYPSASVVVGDYEDVQGYEIVSGEVFDSSDITFDENVVVVSDSFAEAVLEDTGQSVMGQDIVVGGQKLTVIGVIESNSNNFARGDGLILIPYSKAVGTLTNSKEFSSVTIILQDSSYYEIAGQDLLAGLNASRQLVSDSEDVFSVSTSQEFIETAEETTGMISLFLGIVGGISLFVGGIGTMNMMLTTVTERTKEIGLRKAIGARDRDIMIQILIESVVLTSIGGTIGILLSLVTSKIANEVFADSELINVLVNSYVIVLAATVSIAVGIIFGLYPARNASRLLPADALRSD